MNRLGKPITILYADDDAEDRMLVKEAWEENRLANELHFVEDGEELLPLLVRVLEQGGSPRTVAGSAPDPIGPITRAPLAACSSPCAVDAVTNTAWSR